MSRKTIFLFHYKQSVFACFCWFWVVVAGDVVMIAAAAAAAAAFENKSAAHVGP
jgi:hypothetical protein